MADIPWQQLTILLTVATASHFAFKRFQIPTIIGEIFIGILLGPSILGQFLGPDFFDPAFTGIFAALGAIILLFIIGLDMDISAVYSKQNIAIAIGGVVLPWLSGYFVADMMLPGVSFAAKVFIGATLVATSVAVTAAILLELDAINTDVAKTVIGAAVVDDVLGLLVLSISIDISRNSVDPATLVMLVGVAVIFLVVATFIGIRYFTRLVNWAENKGRRSGLKHTGFTLALGLTFLYSFLANHAGLNAIVGAFIAGAAFSKSSLTEDFQQGAEYLGAIFTPIFFVSLGIQVNLLFLDSGLLTFGVVLAFVAIAAKLFGCWIPAQLSGIPRNKSMAIGLGMIPRGEVGLVIASTALGLMVISQALYSIMVLVLIITTVIPPPFFRRCLLRDMKNERENRLMQGLP